MKNLIANIDFWIAMIVAVALKLRCSERITALGAVVTTFTAVGAALIFTDPMIDWLGLDGDTYMTAVAALVALSFDHIARQILNIGINDIIRIWLGRRK